MEENEQLIGTRIIILKNELFIFMILSILQGKITWVQQMCQTVFQYLFASTCIQFVLFVYCFFNQTIKICYHF